MYAFFDLLYREYCRARLAEMRSILLLADSRDAPQPSCDGAQLEGSSSSKLPEQPSAAAPVSK